MSYKIEITSYFKKQAKRLLKKYPSLKNELSVVVSLLETNPQSGESLGNGCYKIRVSIASKGKGKSGGARIITYVRVVQKHIYLLSIYDKSEQSSISNKELEFLLELLQQKD